MQLQYSTQASKKPCMKGPDYSSLVPYFSHCSDDAVITSDGRIIRSILLKGFGSDFCGDNCDIRSVIRTALKNCILQSDICVWVHTHRSKRDIPHECHDEVHNNFCTKLMTAVHSQEELFVNDLYISFVADSKCLKVPPSLLGAPFLQARGSNKIDFALQILDNVTQNLSDALKQLSPVTLKLQYNDGRLESQYMSFFRLILQITRDHSHTAAPHSSMGSLLVSSNTQFESDFIKLKTDLNLDKYVTTFNIKGSMEISRETANDILSIQNSFLITHVLYYTPLKKKHIKFFKHLTKYSKLSEESSIINRKMKLQSLSHPSDQKEFCESISLVTISADTPILLEEKVSSIISKFTSIGCVMVRNDLRLQKSYLSSLPGNFGLLSNPKLVHYSNALPFALIYIDTPGTMVSKNGHYALHMFKSMNGFPYFFNIKSGTKNNIIAIGYSENHKTKFINFIAARSYMQHQKVICIDALHSMSALTQKLDGTYVNVSNTTPLDCNILKLFDNEDDVLQLIHRMLFMRNTDGDTHASIVSAARHILSISPDQRTLDDFSQILIKIDRNGLRWNNTGRCSDIFSNKDTFTLNNQFTCINLDSVIHNSSVLPTLIFVLLESMLINALIDNTLIIIRNPTKFESGFFSVKYLETWLQRTHAAGINVMFVIDNFEEFMNSKISSIIIQSSSTTIATPGIFSRALSNLQISDAEEISIKSMSSSEGHFFVKQDGESIIAEFKLSECEESNILSRATM